MPVEGKEWKGEGGFEKVLGAWVFILLWGSGGSGGGGGRGGWSVFASTGRRWVKGEDEGIEVKARGSLAEAGKGDMG